MRPDLTRKQEVFQVSLSSRVVLPRERNTPVAGYCNYAPQG